MILCEGSEGHSGGEDHSSTCTQSENKHIIDNNPIKSDTLMVYCTAIPTAIPRENSSWFLYDYSIPRETQVQGPGQYWINPQIL